MKKRLAWLVLVAGLCFPAFSQDKVAIRYSELINPESARTHLSILASDAFEGRETGQPGADKAARYLAAELKKLGLEAPVAGSYFQSVPLLQSTLQVGHFSVNGSKLVNFADFYINGKPSYRDLKAKKIVFAGYGISSDKYDDLSGLDIKDKVVLVYNSGEPLKDSVSVVTGSSQKSEWSRIRNYRIDFLKARRPALILSVNPALAAILQSHKQELAEGALSLRNDKVIGGSGETPVVAITPETADMFLQSSGKTLDALMGSINATGRPATRIVKADFQAAFGAKDKEVKAVNVLGFIPGADLKNEVVVISAHYDHVGLNPGGADTVFNGADDDGSGTTAVLQLASAFAKAKKEGKGPRRSILFLFNVGEEKGLLGSEWYSSHPVFPLENTIADLNIDMIGRVDPSHRTDTNYCYLIGSDRLSSELHRISENANAAYTRLKIDYKYNDPNDPEQIYYRSDHYNFAKHSIPIIFYFNGVHEDYHRESDEVSKINFPLLTKRAQLVFFTAWDLSNRDKRPVVDVKAK